MSHLLQDTRTNKSKKFKHWIKYVLMIWDKIDWIMFFMDFNKFEIALTFVFWFIQENIYGEFPNLEKIKIKYVIFFRQPAKVRIFHSYLGTLA